MVGAEGLHEMRPEPVTWPCQLHANLLSQQGEQAILVTRRTNKPPRYTSRKGSCDIFLPRERPWEDMQVPGSSQGLAREAAC
jgi:hypothetical protein